MTKYRNDLFLQLENKYKYKYIAMNKEDLENYLSTDDIREIAKESKCTLDTVYKVISGRTKRSVCKPFIMARLKRNKERII